MVTLLELPRDVVVSLVKGAEQHRVEVDCPDSIVIHCERGDGTVIRIIPARKADRQERAVYVERRAP